jgi:sec-independent protein translocase protein TatA
MPILGLMGLGPTEIIIIVIVLVLLFGATQIPRLARSLGQSATEFKKGLSEGGKDKDEEKDEDENKKDDKA